MDNDKNHKGEESKPRLRWSYELHHRFIEAVNQLGGPNSSATKARPKGLMRILEIPELTFYHLKSHLQKYRLGISERFIGNNQDAAKSQERQIQNQPDIIVTKEKDDEPNKNFQIKEATEIQLKVQKKLHEQIERKLQVRIDAQGKYLQTVLLKAQETLSGHKSSKIYGVASMTSRSCLSSEDDKAEEEYDFLGHKKPENRGIELLRSSVVSSESSEAEHYLHSQTVMRRSNKLQFTEIKPEEVMDRKKRSWDDVLCVEQSIRKRAYGGYAGEDLGLSFK